MQVFVGILPELALTGYPLLKKMLYYIDVYNIVSIQI